MCPAAPRLVFAAAASLKKMMPNKCTVTRDGQEQKVDAHELVPGDLVRLYIGDRVPADIRIIETADLKVWTLLAFPAAVQLHGHTCNKLQPLACSWLPGSVRCCKIQHSTVQVMLWARQNERQQDHGSWQQHGSTQQRLELVSG
jgi:hypothetical protein